ncbi:MAG: hypothetical protein K6C32_03990 [Bacilli bacterium]|nr:hypothetical protein [Bacilli bacterium]
MITNGTTSLKRAYCTHCKTDNEMNRIFEVNPDANVCYCPYCMAELKPKEAIEDYKYFISTKLLKANRLLYQDTNFYVAYCAFAHIIEIDPKSVEARFGRISALIYMSTLRRSYFEDVITLTSQEASNYFRKLYNQERYLKMISKMNAAVDEYYRRFPKRVMYKDRFYDVKCVELYYTRLKEIITFKKFLLEEVDRIKGKLENGKADAEYIAIEKSIKELEMFFASKTVILDGTRYQAVQANEKGELLLSSFEEKLNPINPKRIGKLDENDGKGHLIKDKVYPDNTYIAKLVKISLPAMIAFIVLGIGALITYFVGPESLKLLFLILMIVFFVFGLTSLILFIIWKTKLAKRRHLID